MQNKTRLLSFLLFFFASSPLLAENPLAYSLPGGIMGPASTGLLFPGFNVAGTINPAALTSERATALQVAFSPGISAGSTSSAYGSVATSNKKLAMSAGYSGANIGGPTLSHSAFAALGFKFGDVAFGLDVHNQNFSPTANFVDIGFQYNAEGNIVIGGSFYSLNSAAQLGLGIGYKAGRRYHLEANLILPPFNSFGAGYILLVGAGMNVSLFDVYFSVGYYLNPGAYSTFYYLFGTAIWLGKSVNLFVQYASLQGSFWGLFTTGLTFVF